MGVQDLLPHELVKLKNIAKRNSRKAVLSPLLAISAILLIGFIPMKFLPRRWSNSGSSVPDGNLATFVGLNNFLVFMVIWIALMIWASLSTYKNISIKKDLKDQRKKTVEGIVNHVDVYEGQHYVRLKKGTGVKIIHFDRSNYRPLKVGDKISFEVYEHSNILIQVLSQKPKITQKYQAKVIEVLDKCPACKHPLSADDIECPDCGLNFS